MSNVVLLEQRENAQLPWARTRTLWYWSEYQPPKPPGIACAVWLKQRLNATRPRNIPRHGLERRGNAQLFWVQLRTSYDRSKRRTPTGAQPVELKPRTNTTLPPNHWGHGNKTNCHRFTYNNSDINWEGGKWSTWLGRFFQIFVYLQGWLQSSVIYGSLTGNLNIDSSSAYD